MTRSNPACIFPASQSNRLANPANTIAAAIRTPLTMCMIRNCDVGQEVPVRKLYWKNQTMNGLTIANAPKAATATHIATSMPSVMTRLTQQPSLPKLLVSGRLHVSRRQRHSLEAQMPAYMRHKNSNAGPGFRRPCSLFVS